MNGRMFVLGAGASIGHSEGKFPGIRDFFKLAKMLNITVEGESSRSVPPDFKSLEEYSTNRFGRSIVGASNSIDVEELLTSLQIDIQRTSDSDLTTTERALKRLVRSVLVSLSRDIGNGRGEYDELEELLSPSDTVVTFNWDLLLDRILSRQFDDVHALKEQGRGKGYRAQYRDFVERFAIRNPGMLDKVIKRYEQIPEFPYTENESVTPYYLKLHGSIDWFVCGNTSCRAARELFLVPNPESRYFCQECYEPLVNLLVPPVLNKQLHEIPIIRKVWNAAARAMAKADEVVIWGYSIPPTDFHSRWLLRHARQKHLQRITLIDPAVVGGKETKKGARIQKGLVERVLGIFEGLDQSIEVRFYESFMDYSNQHDIFKKYHIAKKPKGFSEFGLG